MIAEGELETDLPDLVGQAYGTVLEVGPGSGNQLPRYSLAKIDRIYGIEPNLDLRDALWETVEKNGLQNIYTIVPCGLQDLRKLSFYGYHDIVPGTIDTVTCFQVLCSVPKPAEMAQELYRLLKPGGQMIIYEHIKSEDYLTRLVQRMYFLPSGVDRGLTLQSNLQYRLAIRCGPLPSESPHSDVPA